MPPGTGFSKGEADGGVFRGGSEAAMLGRLPLFLCRVALTCSCFGCCVCPGSLLRGHGVTREGPGPPRVGRPHPEPPHTWSSLLTLLASHLNSWKIQARIC